MTSISRTITYLIISSLIVKTTESGEVEETRRHVSSSVNREQQAIAGSHKVSKALVCAEAWCRHSEDSQ